MTMDHHFWLLRHGEYSYADYRIFVGRDNAPIAIDDEIVRYFLDTLKWIPTFNPAKSKLSYGLNMWGPTIIDQKGGFLFQEIFTLWARLFACGPEQFSIQGLFSWQWPFEESTHTISERELQSLGNYEHLMLTRDTCVERLTQLAHFGEQASTGLFFILHLGI